MKSAVILMLTTVPVCNAVTQAAAPARDRARDATPVSSIGVVVVDGAEFSSIQSAIEAAGENQIVLIPSNYQGSDSFHNPNNIRIFDLRRSTPVDSALGRNVREWGAKLDARMVAGCTTLAPAGLRCNGISFIPADAGKTVICYGCGASQGSGHANFVTSIASVVNTHEVRLATAPAFYGAGRNIVYGSDDTEAFNRAIASFRTDNPRSLAAGELAFCGMSIISNTLLFHQYGGEFRGCGWGSFEGNVGSKLIWAGAAGAPMLDLQGGEGATLHDFHLFGNSSAMPIGLQLTRVGTEAFIGSYNHFDHIWFGAMYDGGPDTLSDQPYNMQTGVFAHGPGGNDDFQRFTSVVMNRVKFGSDSDALQAVYWDWQTLLVLYAQNGFSIVGDHVRGRNWFFAGNTLDLSFGSPNFPHLRGIALLDDFGSEHSSQMLTYVNGGSGEVVIHGGKWQAFPSSTIASGKVIDLQTAAGSDSLYLSHFEFTYELPYTGPPLKLVFGSPHGISGQSVTLHDVTGIVPANIVLNPGSATPGIIPPNVTFEWTNDPGNGDAGEESKRIISSADNVLTPYRKDYQGQINLTGGPLWVRRALPPANFICTPRGAAGHNVYTYQATCVAGGAESLPTPKIVCSNTKPLTAVNSNLLTFSNMQACDSYNIYGDIEGALGLLGNVARGYSSDNGINYPHQKFVDDGKPAVGTPVPTVDQTGSVIIDGTLTVNRLRVASTASGAGDAGCELGHAPCRVAATGNISGGSGSIPETLLFHVSGNGGQYRISCSLSGVVPGAAGTAKVCVGYDLLGGAVTDCSNNINLAQASAHSSLNVTGWMRANSSVTYHTTVAGNQSGRYQVGCAAEQVQ